MRYVKGQNADPIQICNNVKEKPEKNCCFSILKYHRRICHFSVIEQHGVI